MSPDDIPQVKALADLSFTTPWSISSFEYEIGSKNAVLKVAVKDSRITGYICIRSFLDATHVMDIAVVEKHRQQGVGSMLFLEALREITKAKPETKHITLEVRESNAAAIELYKKYGFMETGRRKNYYKDPVEDGIIMGMDLDRDVTV